MLPRTVARFGSDAVSWPLWLRVAATVPLVVGTYVLGRSFILTAMDDDPAAAFLLLLLGVFLMYAVPFTRALWRSSASWRHDQMRNGAAARRIEDRAGRPADGTLVGDNFGSAVPVRAPAEPASGGPVSSQGEQQNRA